MKFLNHDASSLEFKHNIKYDIDMLIKIKIKGIF